MNNYPSNDPREYLLRALILPCFVLITGNIGAAIFVCFVELLIAYKVYCDNERARGHEPIKISDIVNMIKRIMESFKEIEYIDKEEARKRRERRLNSLSRNPYKHEKWFMTYGKNCKGNYGEDE